MTEKERGVILHSLGLVKRKRWSYRNYFAGCSELCEPLVAKGWLLRGLANTYHVTNAGAEAAGVLDRVRKQDRYGG